MPQQAGVVSADLMGEFSFDRQTVLALVALLQDLRDGGGRNAKAATYLHADVWSQCLTEVLTPTVEGVLADPQGRQALLDGYVAWCDREAGLS